MVTWSASSENVPALLLAIMRWRDYINGVNRDGRVESMLNTLLLLTMLATLAVLMVGLFSFLKGGAFNKKYSNKLMRARVGFQFVALALLLLLIVSS